MDGDSHERSPAKTDSPDAWKLLLSWSARAPEAGGPQAHYQVQVATRVEAFADTGPLAWDSGKACGARPSVRVPPFALLDATVYFWRVRTWDGAGKVSPWSAAQRIVTSGGSTHGKVPASRHQPAFT